MCPTTDENVSIAKSLLQAVGDALKKNQLNWSKCGSFGVDDCKTNIGCNNSMQTRTLNENKSCFIAGCSCHLTDVGDHQADLYYYFEGSTLRKGILIEFLKFVGLEWEEMSQFVKTRWLCLERYCDKEQQKYPALKSFFKK